MQITLRKANKIQSEILDIVKKLDLSTILVINEFESPKEVVQKASDKFALNLQRRNDLLDSLYEIRKQVAVANSKCGVDQALAEVARLEKDISLYSTLEKMAPKTENSILKSQLSKLEKVTERYYANNVSTSILDEAQIAGFASSLAKARRQKQEIQDELLEINVQNSITLSDKIVAVLAVEGIV